MATPAKRGPAPTPPDKGSFPLDHYGDCTAFQARYLQCVRESKAKSSDCKPVMKEYLECRMQQSALHSRDSQQACLLAAAGRPERPDAPSCGLGCICAITHAFVRCCSFLLLPAVA
jgi:cytochrome c oxidase assembly protein subunit 19